MIYPLIFDERHVKRVTWSTHTVLTVDTDKSLYPLSDICTKSALFKALTFLVLILLIISSNAKCYPSTMDILKATDDVTESLSQLSSSGFVPQNLHRSVKSSDSLPLFCSAPN